MAGHKMLSVRKSYALTLSYACKGRILKLVAWERGILRRMFGGGKSSLVSEDGEMDKEDNVMAKKWKMSKKGRRRRQL